LSSRTQRRQRDGVPSSRCICRQSRMIRGCDSGTAVSSLVALKLADEIRRPVLILQRRWSLSSRTERRQRDGVPTSRCICRQSRMICICRQNRMILGCDSGTAVSSLVALKLADEISPDVVAQLKERFLWMCR